MGADEVLHFFSESLVVLIFVALFLNWKDKPLFILTLLVFSSWLLNSLMFDTVYSWGKARLTWNLWWVALGLPFYIAIFLKIYSRQRSSKDFTILFLMLCLMFSQVLQFIDWNFNGHRFMRTGKMYIIPTINALIAATLVKDVFFQFIERIAGYISKIKRYSGSQVRSPQKPAVRLKHE